MTFYSFDANSFITSWKNYPPHIFPTYWENISEMISEGQVGCTRDIYDEIQRGGDAVAEWVKSREVSLVHEADHDLQMALRAIMARHGDMVDPNGSSAADPWVVALAVITNGHVITYEKRSGPGAKRIKIPNVCESFKVPCSDVIGFFEREQWVFRHR